ncbi:DUF2989 domain-containing protein [Thalassomonas haliotis]|uniref:DUF2989 domain-containing protein n=1 Tax=Thalassomonas haliotis TaxID=485448 RepID=A0ABY7V7U9_9GAMM|nr:DUF2989 domain-containing protein [Thalassomonas haliotis]WDE09661.1 DUF2989 domain-containing protein [Thalassomonas haliotis]
MKLHLIAAISALALSACDKGPNLAQVCDSHPLICQEFKEDNWCKKERTQTIFAGADLQDSPSDQYKYNLLIAYESYAECVSFASQIEHIKLKEKKTRRIDNYIKAKEKIEQLSQETASSEHPQLLYFHWTRYLNERSLEKFLRLEGSPELETPASQLNLATYYAKRDPDKTLDLLFHALELYQAGDVIDSEIFKSLTTIFTDKKEYKQAYIWLKIMRLYDPEDTDLTEKSLKNYQEAFQLDSDFLDQVADTTLDKIKAGQFHSPNLKG